VLDTRVVTEAFLKTAVGGCAQGTRRVSHCIFPDGSFFSLFLPRSPFVFAVHKQNSISATPNAV
jgi:hypothetical protein